MRTSNGVTVTQSSEGLIGCRWTSEGQDSGGSHKEWWLLQKEQWASHSRLLQPWKRKVRAWEEVIRILGCGIEKENEIPIYIGTIDCCHLQGRYPKSKKCSINSFQRSFRCNIHNFSMINTAWAISIQTVPFEKNHTVTATFDISLKRNKSSANPRFENYGQKEWVLYTIR